MRSSFLTRWLVLAALLALAAGSAQAQSVWANSNIAATPTAILDWLSGGPDTQATWTGGAPASGSGTTVQFFQDASTALVNTVLASQTANLDNGATPFQLGALILDGKASASSVIDLFEVISGSALQFSGATGTINLNGVVNGQSVLAFQISSALQLGTAGTACALTATGSGSGGFFIAGNLSELQAGGGSLIKSGSSLLVLSGNNTYTGTTTVSGGQLRLGSPNALPGGIGASGGVSALTLNGGVVELLNNDFLRNLGAGASQFQITGGTSGFSTRGGAHNVIVNNDPTLELKWGSAYFNPSTLVLNDTTADSILTLQNPIDLNGANRTLAVNAGTVLITNVIRSSSGTAGLTKYYSAGTLKLSGANTFTGALSIYGNNNTGILSVNSITNGGVPSPLGASTSAAGNLRLGNLTTFQYTGPTASSDRAFSIAGGAAGDNATLDASGSGPLYLASTNTPGYGTTNQSRSLGLAGSNPGTNTLAAVIADNGSGAVSVSKANGGGTWVLAGANTFTGPVTINGGNNDPAGTLIIPAIANGGSASPLGQSANAAGNLNLGNGNSGATLKYTGPAANTDRSFTVNGGSGGNVFLDASGSGPLGFTNNAALAYGAANQNRTLTLTGTNPGNNTLSALIADNGAGSNTLVKAGAGVWVLNGTAVNTYTAGTTVNGGTLVGDFSNLATPANLIGSTTPITFGGGTLSLLAKTNAASSQTLPNPTFSANAGSGLSLSGTGTGTMGLTLGSTWTRNAGSTLNVTLTKGGTLSSSPTVTNSLVVGSGNLAFATVGGTDWAKVSGGNVVGFASTDYAASLPASSSTSSVNYTNTDNGSVTASETANTLKINTTQNSQSLAITSGQTLTLNAGGLLFVGGNDYGLTGGTLKGSGGTQKELVVHQFGAGNLTIGSVIADNGGATALTKTGPGTLTLTNANPFTGSTYAGGGGTLVLKHPGALTNSPLYLNNCSLVFDSSVSGNAFTIGGLNSSYAGPGYDLALQNNAGTPAAVALTVNGGGTYNGVLSGSGSLIKNGGGTLSLGGFNTFTGGVTINGGAISTSVGNDWFLGGGGPNGNVQVTVNAGATLSLNLNNNLIGACTLNGGTLDSANGFGGTWSGSIILQGNTTNYIATSAYGGTLVVNAVISGTGGLAKNNAGTSIACSLNNANTFTGPTRVINNTGSGSYLTLAHSLALQNSCLDTATSAAGTANSGLKTSVTALTLGGLSGNKNLAALFTTAFAGTHNAGNNGFSTPVGGYSGVTSLTLNPPAGTNVSYSGAIADGATGMALNKTGAGTQTFTAAQTYTGPTTISAGRLALSGSGSLANSGSIVVAANAVLDVSGLSSAFTWLGSQTLSNSAPGAILSGTNNCSAGTLSLVYDGVNPCFLQTNGGLTLSAGTTIKINNTGATLAPGNYTLITNTPAGNPGFVAGAVTSAATVGGSGASATATLSVSGGKLVLQVGSGGSGNPGNFSGISVNGTTLKLLATNGTPNGGWTLLESTNLRLPLAQWPTNRTGNYDGSGSLTTNLLNLATNSAAFFLLK